MKKILLEKVSFIVSLLITANLLTGCGSHFEMTSDVLGKETDSSSAKTPDIPNIPELPVDTTTPTSDRFLEKWNETATFEFFNQTYFFKWKTVGGDWSDAKGLAYGVSPFAIISLIDDNQPNWIEIDALKLIQSTGRADMFFTKSGGTVFNFHSRKSLSNRPQLVLNGNLTLEATADCDLSSSTQMSICKNTTLSSLDGFLLRFEIPTDLQIHSAKVRLYSDGKEYGDQTLQLFSTDSRVRTIARPSWLKNDSTEIATFTGDLWKSEPTSWIRSKDGIVTADMPYPELTWLSKNMQIPAQEQACATVFEKLHSDFRPGQGGKHPGFANTGTAYPGEDVVNGVVYPDTGWGGRSPDGIHWSARTGYGEWDDKYVAARTYFYALSPGGSFGSIDSLGYVFEKGKWSAYVQCMKLNTVSGNTGNADGKLYYEFIGHGPTFNQENIVYRNNAAPESKIREFWIDYYCGGTECGSGHRGKVSFSKAIITKGLPDISQMKKELDRLNQLGPTAE